MLEVNESNFSEEVLKSDVPVVVDFWATWCAPCLKLTPVIEELSEAYQGRVKFVKLNIEESPQIASSYMVMSIPTLIVFKNGVPCGKKVGLLKKIELESFINSYL